MSPLPELVTFAQAVAHLNLPESLLGSPDSQQGADVALKLELATGLVLDYLDRGDDDWIETMIAWDADTVPRPVKAAVLVQLGELFRFRGDDPEKTVPSREHGFLAPMVVAYLHRFRDPALA